MYIPDKGINFRQAVRNLKTKLYKENRDYESMQFNDIVVTVSVDSVEDDIAIIYDLKHRIRQLEGAN